MKTACIAIMFLSLFAGMNVVASNPLAKVVELMDSLLAKIGKDGEKHEAAYKEYFEWCQDFSRETGFEIKTLTRRQARLEAAIEKASSDIDVCSTSIEDLAAAIAEAEKDLNDATVIRQKEHADFAAAEAELVSAIEMLTRAVNVLEREMAKKPSALLQVDTANLAGVMQALSAVLDAAAFSSSDMKKLTSLMQSKQEGEEDDGETGAPAAGSYESKSGGIVEVLQDMKEKAEGELSEARKDEANNQHNFNMVKQSLEDKVSADSKDMNTQKADKAGAEEDKATAQGDLASTVKALAKAQEALATANQDCMQVATDHAQTIKGRAEEIAAIAKAKKILTASTTGAVGQTYSLLQMSSRTHRQAAGSNLIPLLKKLSQEQHSTALAQLTSRVSAVLTFGGADVFGKVKGLIQDMIDKLVQEAAAEATEKAYCDEEMTKTEAKKGDLEADVSKLSAKIDVAVARSTKLKKEVADLQAELAATYKLQEEMDKARQDEHAHYVDAKADLEQGLSGVRGAIEVLRDYYGSKEESEDAAALLQQPAMPQKHEKAGGAGGGIVSILEVVEADFAKNLAQEEQEEADAQSEYDTMTQENKVITAEKKQDAKYKTQESNALDSSIEELASDRETLNTELNAVLEFYASLKDRCVAKPETYEARKQRREAELAGLKQALQILEGESAFVQRGARQGGFLSSD